ncbi:hypothetical protein [Haloarchaeobius sp. TZWSO28]
MTSSAEDSRGWHECPRDGCEKAYFSNMGKEMHLARDHDPITEI